MNGAFPIGTAGRAPQHAHLSMWIAFDRLDYAQQGHAVGRFHQTVAAGSTRMGLDEPRPREVTHDLRQEAWRDVHLFRDLAAAHQPLTMVS